MPTYTCNVCGTDFEYASALTRHMRFHTHTFERLFQCAVCGRRHINLSELDRCIGAHQAIRIHIDGRPSAHITERPYQCALCGNCYRQRRHLYRHMIDERPYRCTLCESFYRQRRNLNRHMQLSHNHRDDELTSGAQATTSTQHTESLHGITSTVSTVTSSQGTAIVTTVQSPTSLVATTTVSQASGTVTVTHPSVELRRDPGNECPICFESLNDGETRTTPCCSKIFHTACLRTVQRNSGEIFPCPHCRKVLTRVWLYNPDLCLF